MDDGLKARSAAAERVPTNPLVSQHDLDAAESFLASLENDVIRMDSVTGTIVQSPQDMEDGELGGEGPKEREEGEVEQDPIPRRKESQIWNGDFGDEKEVDRELRRRCITGSDGQAEQSKIPRSSPGIWVVRKIFLASGIAILSFSVGAEMALASKSWCEGPNLNSERTDQLKVLLGCYSEDELSTRGIDLTTPNAFEKLSVAKTAWSSMCLFIQMNGHIWAPYDLSLQEGPIDLTQSTGAGQNEVEVVQVSGTSKVVFAVLAVHPSEQELDRERKKKHIRQLIRSSHTANSL